MTPGKTYQFSDAYQATIPSELTIQYTMSDGSFAYVFLKKLPVASAWTQTSASFVVPKNVVSLTVFHLIEQVGTLRVDAYA